MSFKERKGYFSMDFTGFTKEDFASFTIDGLDERMTAIQERIQPKFRQLGEELVEDLSMLIGSEMHLHIAKHARRTVNPPNDTWLAIAGNKRGYKKHPHFQVGLWDDRLFVWLAFIYELPHKTDIAKMFIENETKIKDLPKDYYISLDHMKKDGETLEDIDLEKALTRFRDIKKGELLLGKYIYADENILMDGDKLYEEIKQTFQTLIPLYKLAFDAIK